jgi:type I restriction enzyme S subunit
MQEDNLLSLSYGRIIRKDIDANEGLLPESFETYQIVEPGNIVMRLTDLQNDKRSIRQALVTERGIITSAYDAVEVAKDHDARFWAYALLALDLAKYYYSLGAGVRQSIKFADFPNDWIRTPNRETQKSIADFLDYETARINQLIEKKQRQATTLAEREEAAFLNVVTGRNHSGPRGHSGVDWIGDIPVHWSAPKFTYVARQETGHTPSRKEPSYWVPDECTIPWFSLADVWQIRNRGRIYVSETAEKISQVGMENSAARLLPRHTVILSRTASVGFPAVLDVPMAVTQDFVGWICGPQVRPKFLYYVLRSMKPVFRRLMMGSTHQTIYMPDVRAFRLPLPPLHEQDEIITELDRSTGAFRSAAAKITESVGKLREYRSSLITAAVTGWIDIPKNLPVVVSVPDRERFRLIVGAEIIHQHRSNPKFGRVKLQKELYLAEAHLGIRELQGNYCRQAAGPLDRALIDETERLVEAAGFCKTSQADGVGTTVTYTPLGKAGQHNTELKSLLGPRADALGSLINLLRDLGTEAVEAVTTLYAVWNDALIDSRPPDDSTIVNGVLTEWHAEKGKKFKDSDLRHWLDWMKRNGLTPRGKGPRTAHTMTRDMFA